MRVLLVDDEETMRKGMVYLLEQLPFAVKVVGEAKNGEEGMDKFALLHPDYAFIDIRMPKMDGLELVRQWSEQQLSPKTKCIIITAHSEFSYAQQALRYGAADFLLKPVSTHMLMEMFARLTTPKLEKELSPHMGSELIERFITEQRITNTLVKEILLYIGANYMRELQLTDLASKLNVTPVYISGLFKKVTGQNLIAFLQQFRIEISQHILQRHDYKISEVAYMVGFNNLTYFNRVFKAVTSLTPGEFLRGQGKQEQ